MGFFITALILLGIAVGAFIFSRGLKDVVVPEDRYNAERTVSAKVPRLISRAVALVAAILGVVFLGSATIYQQDPGEANVLRSISGEIVGQDLDAGFGFKAPWVDTVGFDIRNQKADFIGDGSTNNAGGIPSGAQITTTDAEGATLNIDIVVNYSIRSDKVTEIYENYQSQENFRDRFIENDVRSIVRLAPNSFSTLEVLTQRGQIQTAITEALQARWEGTGVLIETVALQEIRYSDEVRASFDQAQQARVQVETARANLAAAEVTAQQRVAEATAQAEANLIEANANAEANRLLTESLTPAVLQQRYLDTLSEVGAGGNLVVVPEGFNGLVNVSPTP